MNMVELSMHAGSQAAHMREMVVKVDTGMVIKEEGLGHRRIQGAHVLSMSSQPR